jgi:DNA-binding winged helix-turn-helix (wHTH) protein
MRTRIGEFVLDEDQRLLLRDDAPLHLTPKAFALLAYLAKHAPRATSKSELLQHLWPRTFVSEAALTSVVKELRHDLGDPADDPRYVRSVHGFGYALCAAVSDADAARAPEGERVLEWRVFWNNREYALAQGDNLLGRTHEAAVWVEDATVSRRHAIIHVSGDVATVEDLGSRNGTIVDGQRVTGRRVLAAGTELWLGHAYLVFMRYEHDVSTESAGGADTPVHLQRLPEKAPAV